MKRYRPKSVEILPTEISEYAVGSMKSTTCRVTKNGSNIAMPKVKQPNKQGRDPQLFKKGSEKWRTFTKETKDFWHNIALENEFWSKWQAFMSSFLLSVGIHGIDATMNQDLAYYDSDARFEKYAHLENSIKRLRKHHVDSEDYQKTKATYKKYPVAQDSPVFYPKLFDLWDVNIALKCRLIYRYDPVVEYRYYPEETGEVEKGYYIRTERERIGEEKYELFSISEENSDIFNDS